MLILVGKLLEKIEATCRAWLAISMAVWHKHFTGIFSSRPHCRAKNLWCKMDRRPGGPHNRCGSLYRKENSLASAKNRTPDQLAVHAGLFQNDIKRSSVFEPWMMARSGLLCGSDYRKFICTGALLLSDKCSLWLLVAGVAVGWVDYTNSISEPMGSEKRYVLYRNMPWMLMCRERHFVLVQKLKYLSQSKMHLTKCVLL